MRIFKNGCPSSHQHQCTFQMFFCAAPLLNAQCSRRRAHTLCINATTRAAISHFLRLIVVVVVVIFCRRLYELEEFLANYHAQTKQSNTTVYGIANKCHHKLHVIFFFLLFSSKWYTRMFLPCFFGRREIVLSSSSSRHCCWAAGGHAANIMKSSTEIGHGCSYRCRRCDCTPHVKQNDINCNKFLIKIFYGFPFWCTQTMGNSARAISLLSNQRLAGLHTFPFPRTRCCCCCLMLWHFFGSLNSLQL